MLNLFPEEPSFPSGFSYKENFISETEEAELLRAVSGIALHPFSFQGFEAKRKVASFGYDYRFDKGALIRGKDIPPEFDVLIGKVASAVNVQKTDFAELLVTEYPVGSVINWHRDAPPFEVIAGISLLGNCIFRLRPYKASERTRKSTLSFPVNRRSLYIIQGAARRDWQHSIAPVKVVRYSITLRTLGAQ